MRINNANRTSRQRNYKRRAHPAAPAAHATRGPRRFADRQAHARHHRRLSRKRVTLEAQVQRLRALAAVNASVTSEEIADAKAAREAMLAALAKARRASTRCGWLKPGFPDVTVITFCSSPRHGSKWPKVDI